MTQLNIRRSIGGVTCMGRIGCTQPPVYHLSCPHRPTYKSCLKCFLLTSDEVKCRCPNEDLNHTESTAIPSKEGIDPDEVVIIKQEPAELSDFKLTWHPMTNVNGVIQDQFDLKYTWQRTKNIDRFKEVFYRCTVGDDTSRSQEVTRCPAIVKRIVRKNDGRCTSLQLESLHNHSTKKRLDQEGNLIFIVLCVN